jgi:RecB family endonuclease NucS
VASGQIRALVHDRPDCLEEGLSIYTDAAAKPVGLDFPTDVGTIDLLARDDAGGLVVVLIAPEASQGAAEGGKDSVSQALERVGWVRKHVAEPQQEVRAIVLLEQVPDDFSYTAAAVASTVSFKTYRLEISFSEVEV